MRLLAWRQAVMMRIMVVALFFGVMIVMCMGIVVIMRMCVAEVFLTVEYQEIHAERIEGRDEHTCQHGKLRKACTWKVGCLYRFNNAVF